MGIAYGANYGRPSLDLNFARNKSLIDTISGQNLVTFSRAQANYRTTYVGSDGLIKYASANEPRFDHNPLTGECLGLLIEEQRQNLITYSEDFSNAAWTKTDNVTVTSNAILSPSGNVDADFIVPTSASGVHRIKQTVSGDFNSNYVFSVYAKSAGYSRIALNEQAQTGYSSNIINLTDGSGGSSTTIVTNVGNGWYKISWINTSGAASPKIYGIVILPNGGSGENPNSFNWTADGTSGVYLWGAQLETGSFPTSYIPTTAAAVTRSADSASITGTNFSRWYNQSEGTVFHSGRYIGDVSGGLYGVGNGLMFTFTNSTLNTFTNQWSLGIHKAGGPSNPSSLSDVVFNGTTPVFSGVSDQLANNPVGSQMKSAAFIKTSTGEFGQVLNGGTIRSNSATSIPNWNQLSISTSYIGQVRCGHISRFTYYPTRLQNFQLQQLTK